jgi:predicted transcriptional regulator
MNELARSRRATRSALGLGPLETAIMRALWAAGCQLTIRDIRDRMDHPWVAYTTVATVVTNLYEKGLLARQELSRQESGRHRGAAAWYSPARPAAEHIGSLIAALLDAAPDPGAALQHALTTRTEAGDNGKRQ